MEDIRIDIEKYAAWSDLSESSTSQNVSDSREDLAMSGIFFDEVPNLFTEGVADQLASLSKFVRDTDGFGNASWVCRCTKTKEFKHCADASSGDTQPWNNS